jgi:solute carrier family 35 protein F1/2
VRSKKDRSLSFGGLVGLSLVMTTTFANGHHNDDATIIPSRGGACCYYLKSHWKILLWGQLLSLLLASAGAAQATLHLSCGLSAPTFTMATIYFVLSFHLILVVWRTKKQRNLGGGDAIFHTASDNEEEEASNIQSELNNEDDENLSVILSNSTEEPSSSSSLRLEYSFFGLFPLHRPTWQYAIIAFLDVEANAITMLSFRYTTLTSVTLFDALAIPSTIILSKYFLGRQYTWMHLLGVVTCMTGVVFNVMQDYESDHEDSTSGESNNEYPHKLRGDMLAITGGLLYGLNDVLAEVTIRQAGGTTEYLGVMGFFAFILSLIQALIFEWQDILEFFGRSSSSSETCSPAMGWWLLLVFVAVTLMGYAGASRFLLVSEAAFFNLSLLTGDLWSVLFSIVAERILPQPLFFVALVFVLSGVVLYEMAPSPVMEDRHSEVKKAERLTQLEEDDNDLELRESTSDDDEL